MQDQPAAPAIVALRPFVPASDLPTAIRFYTDLGFTASPLGDGLAAMQYGTFGFLLQAFEAEGFAGNFMMHVLVPDLDAWWARIEALDLGTRYGVRAPAAPKLQPWGLIVAYVVDPSGVLWHFAQDRGSAVTVVVGDFYAMQGALSP